MKFIIPISNSKLPGFQLLKTYDKPVTLESINEYKVLEDGKIARVMHTGVMPIVLKSKLRKEYWLTDRLR